MKKWCVWCECKDYSSRDGYWWIHEVCAEKLMDVHQDLTAIRSILKGTHIRNKDDENKINVIYEFLKDMEVLDRKFQNTIKLFKKQGVEA